MYLCECQICDEFLRISDDVVSCHHEVRKQTRNADILETTLTSVLHQIPAYNEVVVSFPLSIRAALSLRCMDDRAGKENGGDVQPLGST